MEMSRYTTKPRMTGEISTNLELNGPGVVRFPGFVLDLGRGELRVDGQAVRLRPKTFALLALLARNPGRLLSKEALINAVWPDVVVSDDSLVQCVGELRAALGPTAGALIRNLPRRGYLFDATPCAVDEVAAATAAAPAMPAVALLAASQFVRNPDTAVPHSTIADVEPTPPAPSVSSTPATKRPFQRNLLLAFAGAALLAVSTLALRAWQAPTPAHIGHDLAARRSIAVLPFTDLSDQPSPWFAEAVTRDLVSSIARVPDLLVISAFTGAAAGVPSTNPRELGQKLHAKHVLVGSVRRTGPSLQVSAQLVAVESGAVLWTERFEYPAFESSDLERDIAPRVARAMEVSVHDAAAKQRRRSGYTLDSADHVMEGHYILRRNAVPEDMLRARAHFDAALKVDPDSVSALCGWAATHYGKVLKRWSTDPKSDLALASVAVDRALAIDPLYAPAHSGRADLLYLAGKFEDSLGEYETAVRLDPSNARNYTRIGLIKLGLGRPGEVAAHMAQAQRISPLETMFIVSYAQSFAGIAAFHLGHDDEAYAHMRQAATVNPKYAPSYSYMAAIDALHGRMGDAAINLTEFRRLLPKHTLSSLRASEVSRNEIYWVGANRYYEGLRKAGLPD